MKANDDELDDLHPSQPHLPPQVLGPQLGISHDGRQSVVKVHEGVDERVAGGEENAVTSGRHLYGKPERQRNGEMVENVEKRYVFVLFS